MTAEEEAYVVALRRRRRLGEDDADRWDLEDAGHRVAAARKALIELGANREHLRHLEECALPVDEWIARLGNPARLGQLRRISPVAVAERARPEPAA